MLYIIRNFLAKSRWITRELNEDNDFGPPVAFPRKNMTCLLDPWHIKLEFFVLGKIFIKGGG